MGRAARCRSPKATVENKQQRPNVVFLDLRVLDWNVKFIWLLWKIYPWIWTDSPWGPFRPIEEGLIQELSFNWQSWLTTTNLRGQTNREIRVYIPKQLLENIIMYIHFVDQTCANYYSQLPRHRSRWKVLVIKTSLHKGSAQLRYHRPLWRTP